MRYNTREWARAVAPGRGWPEMERRRGLCLCVAATLGLLGGDGPAGAAPSPDETAPATIAAEAPPPVDLETPGGVTVTLPELPGDRDPPGTKTAKIPPLPKPAPAPAAAQPPPPPQPPPAPSPPPPRKAPEPESTPPAGAAPPAPAAERRAPRRRAVPAGVRRAAQLDGTLQELAARVRSWSRRAEARERAAALAREARTRATPAPLQDMVIGRFVPPVPALQVAAAPPDDAVPAPALLAFLAGVLLMLGVLLPERMLARVGAARANRVRGSALLLGLAAVMGGFAVLFAAS